MFSTHHPPFRKIIVLDPSTGVRAKQVASPDCATLKRRSAWFCWLLLLLVGLLLEEDDDADDEEDEEGILAAATIALVPAAGTDSKDADKESLDEDPSARETAELLAKFP